MSRRSPRVRVVLAVTVTTGADRVPCRTRDVSDSGLFLEMPDALAAGTPLEITLLDADRGEVVQVAGEVVRSIDPQGAGLAGVACRLLDPPEEWRALVLRLQTRQRDAAPARVRRLRVLVIGDEARRRGALALYVRSGWDIRFASDLAGAREALQGQRIDATIAEHELEDDRWMPVLEAARAAQPAARRIVRARLAGRPAPPPGGPGDLYHRVVDSDAGLEALLDALTAEWG